MPDKETAIQSYRDLRVWQEAMDIAELCYRLTRSFPREELFALVGQIRRSASSVPANIAEGHGRELTRSFIQFLRVAQGSLKELETHLLLAERVGVTPAGSTRDLMQRCEGLGKMLRTYIRALQRRAPEK